MKKVKCFFVANYYWHYLLLFYHLYICYFFIAFNYIYYFVW